jgi:hypothetical protein
MPLIYSEGKDKALQRLREEINKALNGRSFLVFHEHLSRTNAHHGIRKLLTLSGFKHDDFAVAFSPSNVSDIEHFMARKTELVEIHKALSSDGSRRAVILHSLGRIGKTQLSITYAKRHKDNYSVLFWLNIKDEDSLKQSFAKVVKQILREQLLAIWLYNVDINKNLNKIVDTVKV